MSKKTNSIEGFLLLLGILLLVGIIFSIIKFIVEFVILNYKIILIILLVIIIVAIIIAITILLIKHHNNKSSYYSNEDTNKENKILENLTNTKNNDEQSQENNYDLNTDLSNLTTIVSDILSKKEQQKIENTKQTYHLKTKTISDNEKYFLDIIRKHYGHQYEIRPQVPLSNIIEKEKHFSREYQNELNRIIDIGIFDKETTMPLLLIEINDSTHRQKHRKERDKKVKNICAEAQINLITFWTDYSNTEQYIVERISKELNKSI